MKHKQIIIGLMVFGFVSSVWGAEGPKLGVSGFFIPSYSVATSAVESYGQPNFSAFTAAANPFLANAPDAYRSAFELAQTRLALTLTVDENTSGLTEVDFIDFTKATPTTASVPRIRRAYAEHAFADGLRLRVGQDWDITAPLTPHSYNFVGGYFEAGNIGFMRIQAQVIRQSGSWEHALAVGMPGSNNSNQDGVLELNGVPTLAVRESMALENGGRLGVSVLATAIRLSLDSSSRELAGALNGFVEFKPSADFELRAEIYAGQNTANLGMLGLGYATASLRRVYEAGAWSTAKLGVATNCFLFGGVGGAWVLNSDSMPSSYSLSSTGSRALASTGPGLERNLTARIGTEYRFTDRFLLYFEASYLLSRHHFLAADVGLNDPNRNALVTQVGTFLSL